VKWWIWCSSRISGSYDAGNADLQFFVIQGYCCWRQIEISIVKSGADSKLFRHVMWSSHVIHCYRSKGKSPSDVSLWLLNRIILWDELYDGHCTHMGLSTFHGQQKDMLAGSKSSYSIYAHCSLITIAYCASIYTFSNIVMRATHYSRSQALCCVWSHNALWRSHLKRYPRMHTRHVKLAKFPG